MLLEYQSQVLLCVYYLDKLLMLHDFIFLPAVPISPDQLHSQGHLMTIKFCSFVLNCVIDLGSN